MKNSYGETKYDEYYQVENLFGEPCIELINYFADQAKKGEIIDLGCGQGRNAIALARLGFDVFGIDISKTGIAQMLKISQLEKLKLRAQVEDIYSFEDFENFDFILLDSMLHFAKNDKASEINLLKKISLKMNVNSKVVISNQDTGDKIEIIKEIFETNGVFKCELTKDFNYVFHDSTSDHRSVTPYKLLVYHKFKTLPQ